MRILICILTLAGFLPAAEMLSWRRAGNAFFVQTDEGACEIEFITSATFRYARRLTPITGRRSNTDTLEVTAAERTDRLSLSTRYLTVHLFKNGMRLQVDDNTGEVLAAFADRAMEQELELKRYGFFFTPRGYGLSRNRNGDCFFHYGPTPKEIFEQRYSTMEPLRQLDYSDLRVLSPASLPPQSARLRPHGEPSWSALTGIVNAAIEASLGGVIFSAFQLDSWITAPAGLRRRAYQLASVFPLVYKQSDARIQLSEMRRMLASYLVTYFWEARDRGLPVIRPLAIQYPHDPECARETSVFMLGDELLIVPITSPEAKREFYLPQGVWTDLTTNEVLRGKRWIQIPAPNHLPIYLRNGSILPIDADPLELHYTPTLAAEWFLYEPDLDDYSQFHASPAGDYMRLEMECKKSRSVKWVIHHVDRPGGIQRFAEASSEKALRPGYWYYHAAKRNLLVAAEAPAGADVIINIR